MPRRSRIFERPDYWILAIVGILCLVGVLMVYSSSGIQPEDSTSLIGKHIQWLLIGVVVLIVTMSVPYQRWRRYSVPGIAVAVVLLAIVLWGPSFISEEVLGAKRWLSFGSFPATLQPSELAKLAFILYLGDWCASRGEKVRDFSYGLLPFGIVMGILAVLIFMEPDMGTTLVIFSVGIAMYFVSGASLLHLGSGLLMAGVAFGFAAVAAPYRMQRILAFLDPWHDPQGVSYHSVQSLLALGSGGLWGMGLGASRQKFGWLPEQSTDAIFSVWGQELGFLGAALVIVLFLVLAWRGYRIALQAPDGFAQLLATGVTTWIVFQAMLNIGAVSGAVPFTGVPLPFVSYGGSSLVITLAAVGILLNVSKYSQARVPAGAQQAAGARVVRLQARG